MFQAAPCKTKLLQIRYDQLFQDGFVPCSRFDNIANHDILILSHHTNSFDGQLPVLDG